ncbi:MAG: histidine phosphatase family protein [Sphaerochaetaceae bacterium]|nr:histidine phosphatase family protein [Sphaerochaetaceae bacterium]
MKVFITRHGETELNEKRLVCGQMEAKLTQLGISQAKNLASSILEKKEEYNIKHIFVSPLERARVTASFIEEALGIKAIVDSRLLEQDFGKMDTASWYDEAFLKIRKSPFERFPGGESVVDVAHRAYSFLDELKTKKLEGNVLIVCHGTFSRIMSTYFNSVTFEQYLDLKWKNCEIRAFDFNY